MDAGDICIRLVYRTRINFTTYECNFRQYNHQAT